MLKRSPAPGLGGAAAGSSGTGRRGRAFFAAPSFGVEKSRPARSLVKGCAFLLLLLFLFLLGDVGTLRSVLASILGPQGEPARHLAWVTTSSSASLGGSRRLRGEASRP